MDLGRNQPTLSWIVDTKKKVNEFRYKAKEEIQSRRKKIEEMASLIYLN